MAQIDILRWRFYYSRRRREWRPWMDVSPPVGGALLKEQGSYILTETGDQILLE